MAAGSLSHRIRTSMGHRPGLPSHIGRLDGLRACERPFCPFRQTLAGHSYGLGLGRFPRCLSTQLRRTVRAVYLRPVSMHGQNRPLHRRTNFKAQLAKRTVFLRRKHEIKKARKRFVLAGYTGKGGNAFPPALKAWTTCSTAARDRRPGCASCPHHGSPPS